MASLPLARCDADECNEIPEGHVHSRNDQGQQCVTSLCRRHLDRLALMLRDRIPEWEVARRGIKVCDAGLN